MARLAHILIVVLILAASGGAWAAETSPPPAAGNVTALEAQCAGGLVVLAGCNDPALAEELAATGRYLVQVFEPDAKTVGAMQSRFHTAGLYGLVSAEVVASLEKLPLSEHLANVLLVGPAAAGELKQGEAARVVCPGGLIGLPAADGEAIGKHRWKLAKAPWPEAIDQWSHARHGPDGNPVSADLGVGPPRRIRWVTGPQQEISNMVTAGGRNYYAGVLVRDSFNGLKLWQTALQPSPARGGYNSAGQAESVLPVATRDRLYVVHDRKLQALDAATGRVAREYASAGVPSSILVVDGANHGRPAGIRTSIVAVDKTGVAVVDAETDAPRWRFEAVAPRYVVADRDAVYLVHGEASKNAHRLTMLNMRDGSTRWELADLAWAGRIRTLVCRPDVLVCELSTLSDDKPNNAIHVLDASSGAPLWQREFVPGMTHKKQARAMFARGLLWTLEERFCFGLDPRSGEVRHKFPAGNGHCFPPVATERYLFAGELDMTDLATGDVEANRITKGACSRDAGWIPANGLIYTAPKHCICWPMLRDYSALAPERPAGPALTTTDPSSFVLERGNAAPQSASSPQSTSAPQAASEFDWPCYRHDAWRSGSTAAAVPAALKVRWTTALGDRPPGIIADDWRGNYFIRGPVGPPVIVGDRVFVTRPDAHEVVALDARSGAVVWRFTANGRVDTAPTIHEGRCLFGCKSGWVYCLSAATGDVLWRLRAAPVDERIVAYGQLESPWPVPGSVLVADGVAYFAAGRQALADGGILVFAVDPRNGKPIWVQRLAQVPQTKFYDSSGLEFDNFDLLHREGDRIAMSRWYFDMKTGAMTCEAKSGFARVGTVAGNVNGSVMFPRGAWSYAPRNETEQWKERPYVRPLAVFRGNALYTCSQDRATAFRRDFDLGNGEQFDSEWFKGWDTYARARKGGELWQSQRLANNTRWSAVPCAEKAPIAAMVLTRDALFAATPNGRLTAISPGDGTTLGSVQVPPVAWDSLAATAGRLFFTSQSGEVVCLEAAGIGD